VTALLVSISPCPSHQLFGFLSESLWQDGAFLLASCVESATMDRLRKRIPSLKDADWLDFLLIAAGICSVLLLVILLIVTILW
jgi:hypothetical protein